MMKDGKKWCNNQVDNYQRMELCLYKKQSPSSSSYYYYDDDAETIRKVLFLKKLYFHFHFRYRLQLLKLMLGCY